VVSDGTAIGPDWREAGDEAILLAERLVGVPVIIGGDRVGAGRLAIERFRPGVIFLDDGLQHRRIHRDADLVLLDATDPFGGGRLLPRGRLREPIANLARAHGILVTRADLAGDLDALTTRIARVAPRCPIGVSVFRPHRLRDLTSARERPLPELRGKRVVAVSGVGNPKSFQRTVVGAGAVVVGSLEFGDHHVFTADDRRRMGEMVRRHAAEWIVTTEKDAVRLRPRLPDQCPVIAVGVDLEILSGAEALEAALGVPVRVGGRG
jgi:tetraacyldisaccharide 4'-kinase